MYRSKAEENLKNVKDRFVDRNLRGTHNRFFSDLRIYRNSILSST